MCHEMEPSHVYFVVSEQATCSGVPQDPTACVVLLVPSEIDHDSLVVLCVFLNGCKAVLYRRTTSTFAWSCLS